MSEQEEILSEKKIEETKKKSTKKQKNRAAEEKPETVIENLKEIKNQKGIIGYILRNTESASIDLKDPKKLIDFAVISSSALEAGENLSSLFKLGDVRKVLIEGKEAKVLSLAIGENKISVFMENKVDQDKIYKKIT
jgi:predicted regulator of Ras-like GTPase activity (Roadblock/LC7/MglB family)